MPPRDLKQQHAKQEIEIAEEIALSSKEISFMTQMMLKTIDACIQAVHNEVTHIGNKTGGTDRKKRARALRKRDLELAEAGLRSAKTSCDASRAFGIIEALMENNNHITRGCKTRLTAVYDAFKKGKETVVDVLDKSDFTQLTGSQCVNMMGFMSWSDDLSAFIKRYGDQAIDNLSVDAVLQPLDKIPIWDHTKNITFIQHLTTGMNEIKNTSGYGFMKLIEFTDKEFSSENINFLAAVHALDRITDPTAKERAFHEIYTQFIPHTATTPVNIDYRSRDSLTQDYQQYLADNTGTVALPNLDNAVKQIKSLLSTDTMRRLKSQVLREDFEVSVKASTPKL